jgi:hypothetical protein
MVCNVLRIVNTGEITAKHLQHLLSLRNEKELEIPKPGLLEYQA